MSSVLDILKMEKYLNFYLRCCTFFGIYVRGPATSGKTELNELGRPHTTQAWFNKPKEPSELNITLIFWLQRLYLTALALIVFILYVHGLCTREIVDYLLITWLVATLVYTWQVFTHFLIFMEALWKLDEHERFLLLLQDIQVSLKLRLKCDVREQLLRRSLRCILVFLLLLSAVGLCAFTAVSVLLNDIGYFYHAAWTILTLRVRIIQTLIYTRILCHYLECLCMKLRQVVACRTLPCIQLLDINYKKLESIEFLLLIKDNYALIFKAMHLLNDFAGWSIFGIISAYMLDFTCHVYWTLLGLDGYDSPYNYLVGLLAVFPFSVIVCYLCFLCDKCKRLGNTIAVLVSRLVAVTSSQPAICYCNVAHQFSLQLQLEPVALTAQHFFVLDLRLIMSICTAIATNLVILIQFLKIEHN